MSEVFYAPEMKIIIDYTGEVRSSNSEFCKVTKVDDKTFLYSFEDRDDFDFDEPLIELKFIDGNKVKVRAVKHQGDWGADVYLFGRKVLENVNGSNLPEKTVPISHLNLYDYKTVIIMATYDIFGRKTLNSIRNLKVHTTLPYRLIIVETHYDDTDYNHAEDMNIAPKGTDANFYVFINDDLYVRSGWLDALIETALQDPKIGIVGGLFFYPDGRIQHAGGTLISYDENRIDQIHVNHRFYQMKIEEARGALEQRDCPFVTGALMLIKKECIKDIGIWDENLKRAWNDVEYGFRAWFKGWRVVYTPLCQAIHEEGATFRQSKQFAPTGFNPYFKSWQHLHGRWTRQDYEQLIRIVSESNLKHYGVKVYPVGFTW